MALSESWKVTDVPTDHSHYDFGLDRLAAVRINLHLEHGAGHVMPLLLENGADSIAPAYGIDHVDDVCLLGLENPGIAGGVGKTPLDALHTLSIGTETHGGDHSKMRHGCPPFAANSRAMWPIRPADRDGPSPAGRLLDGVEHNGFPEVA